MTTDTERKALQDARETAIQQTTKRLRFFTGIPGYTPDLATPEHVSYIAYERDLQIGHEIWSENLRSSEANLNRLIALRETARESMEAVQDRRREERAGSNIAGRVLGLAKEFTYPEKRHFQYRERQVDEAHEERQQCSWNLKTVDEELEKVTSWVEQMFSDVDRARIERRELKEAEQLEREQAGRDVSSRWCTVETPDDFIKGDPLRLARMQGTQIVLEGGVMGTGWRRDGDDVGNNRGSWLLAWNPKNNETYLELTAHNRDAVVWLLGTKITTQQQADALYDPIAGRISERNSLALVLDAYKAI